MKQTSCVAPDRVIGLDAHPDSFAAAILHGPTPATAIVEKTFDHVPLALLPKWACKYTTAKDQFVLEASGNSFQIARTLATVERQALVLESCHVGKLKDTHANNDKISAVRLGKAFLAGTAKPVWVPDDQAQARRDLMLAHRKAVKRSTQTRNRLLSYLSDKGVRLKKGTALTEARLRAATAWSPRQWQVVAGYLLELDHATQQRDHWRSLIAQEVLADPQLLQLVRLCGVRDVVAFSLGAIIGDITRFANPRRLVKYVGLNPAFDDSGKGEWHGGLSGHGRKDLRALLIESAQAILRTPKHPLAKWGRKLLARKSARNIAVAAIARKLTVAIWYLMMGKWTAVEEIDAALAQKVGKIITQVGPEGLQYLGKTRKELRAQTLLALQASRVPAPQPKQPAAPKPSHTPKKVYVLKPLQPFTPKRRAPQKRLVTTENVAG